MGADAVVDWRAAARTIPGGPRGVRELAALMRAECPRKLADVDSVDFRHGSHRALYPGSEIHVASKASYLQAKFISFLSKYLTFI